MEKKLLQPETRVSFHRDRDTEFRKYSSMDKTMSLAYCTNMNGLMNLRKIFINLNSVYAELQIVHSTVVKEQYGQMEEFLAEIKYADHKWDICGNLKILTSLCNSLGTQNIPSIYACRIVGYGLGIERII